MHALGTVTKLGGRGLILRFSPVPVGATPDSRFYERIARRAPKDLAVRLARHPHSRLREHARRQRDGRTVAHRLSEGIAVATA
jgi:hypothetical protein